jgi:hypothetical protein
MADLFSLEASHDEEEPAEKSHQGNGAGITPELAALFEQFNALGQDLYGDQWEQVCRRNVNRISGGKTQESGKLTPEQIQKLTTGMMKIKSKREPVAVPS